MYFRKKNVGETDSYIRFLAGVAFFLNIFILNVHVAVTSILAIAGIVMIYSWYYRYCFFYAILDINTMGRFEGDDRCTSDNHEIFTGRKRKIILAVGNCVIPRGGVFETGALDFDFISVLENYAKSMNVLFRKGLPVFIYFVEIIPIFSRQKFFSNLSEEEAVEFLTGYENSVLFYKRMIVLSLRAMILLSVYNDDRAAENMGYVHLKNLNR